MAQYSKIEAYTGTELISLAEAKQYLRVDYTTDDTYITELIKIVRVQVLKDTNQVVVDQTITEYFSAWPRGTIIDLQYPGTIEISIAAAAEGETPEVEASPVLKYFDNDNEEQTAELDTDYRVIQYLGLLKIELINKPNLYNRTEAISFEYVVTPDNSDAIAPLKIAMYMLIQHYYDNRNAVSFLKAEELPLGYKSIIANYKNYIL
tara:strand:+ start:1523 stop:2140 length:618 start_codon:yes stop_codon:yes gene_type:complete